ncbi:hypothetical protein [Morganella morganii]|uniref:hypothetical protein n=1 Tax=Morganella morganii TaxID=582 RepID=UPI0034E47DB8
MSLKQMDTGEAKAKYEKLSKILTVDGNYFVFRLSDDEINNYEINIEACNTAEKLISWVYHLTEKQWMTVDLLRYFIQVASKKSNINIR